MPIVQIHINEELCQYELTGSVSDLWANRRARFYMKDYLSAEMISNSIIIRFSKDNEAQRDKILTQIQEMLSKFDFVENLSDSSKQVLTDFIEEQGKFKEFSEKAKQIWANKLDKSEFHSFTEVLTQEMTHRRLYDLQLLAAYHLAFSQNACNFSVPGAGKTSVVYAAYAYLKNLPKDDKKYVNKLFIIGPLSSFGPWVDEYVSCFGEQPDIQRLSGGVKREERLRHFLSPHSAEITLISYQSVVSSLEDIISYLRRYENRVMVVLDEAHKIKNTDGGIWAQSILSLSKYCKSRVVLTGTPTPNGYEDIYNLYNFIWPDKDIVQYPLYQLKEMSQNDSDTRIPSLIESLSPFFIRITKNDLKKYMELPDAIENKPISVEMGPAQRAIYDFIENRYIDYFQSSLASESISSTLMKSRMIRLMQAATNPSLLRKPIEEYYQANGISNNLFIEDSDFIDRVMNFTDVEVPQKFRQALDLTKNILSKGQKVVIWCIFIDNMKDLYRFFSQEGIESRLLIGETPVETDSFADSKTETREQIVKEFNSPTSSFNVIIANPFAVAESISLHKGCRNAIYLERNFNAATFLQSKDRIHRVGLKKTDEVNYYYILAADSIDETIDRKLRQKEQRMLAIIESREIPLISMNMGDDSDLEKDDIKALILDYVNRPSKNR